MPVDDPGDHSIREGEPPYRPTPTSSHEPEPSEAQHAERKKRARGRVFASLFMIGFGVVLIFWFDGYSMGRLIPVSWVGGFLVGVGALGLLGFNVFAGGPFDRRLDDVSPPDDRSERHDETA